MNIASQPFYLGLDTGYGTLKFAHGDNQEPRECALPSGATPPELLPRRIDESIGLLDGADVMSVGRRWLGGVGPMDIQRHAAELDEDYPRIERHGPLYCTALPECDVDRIDSIVTRLPVRYPLQDGNNDEALAAGQALTGNARGFWPFAHDMRGRR